MIILFVEFSVRFASHSTSSTVTTGARTEKSPKEIWLSDLGVIMSINDCNILNSPFLVSFVKAYPVMSIIAFAVIFSSSAVLWNMKNNIDAKFTKDKRKNPFRGDNRLDLISE